jgi:hypothetical protein
MMKVYTIDHCVTFVSSLVIFIGLVGVSSSHIFYHI